MINPLRNMARRFPRWRRWMPWISLAAGLVGGVWMDRGPEKAWWIVVAALLCWVGLGASIFTLRADLLMHHPHWTMHARRWAVRMASQSSTQQLLLFSLPFYVRAASPRLGHGVFVLVLVVTAGACLWDPLHAAVLRRPYMAGVLNGVATLAGLNTVLPMLGLSNGSSLLAAGMCTAVAMVITVYVSATHRRIQHLLGAGLGACIFLWGLQKPACRRWVPAAPLRLAYAALGTQIAGDRLLDPQAHFATVPNQLTCFTQIWAPRGLHDVLYHVWYHNERFQDRIALQIVGGQARGFRTWSVKQNLGSKPGGLWRCEVQTELGQVIGQVQASVSEL